MIKPITSEVTLIDTMCPIGGIYEEEQEDIKALVHKFGLCKVPHVLELSLSDWLLKKIKSVLVLMQENDLTETSFYSANPKDDEARATFLLKDVAGLEIKVPSYQFCQGFAPRPVYDSSFFEVSLQYPYNSHLKVRVLLANSYSEAALFAYFSLADLGVIPKKTFKPNVKCAE